MEIRRYIESEDVQYTDKECFGDVDCKSVLAENEIEIVLYRHCGFVFGLVTFGLTFIGYDFVVAGKALDEVCKNFVGVGDVDTMKFYHRRIHICVNVAVDIIEFDDVSLVAFAVGVHIARVVARVSLKGYCECRLLDSGKIESVIDDVNYFVDIDACAYIEEQRAVHKTQELYERTEFHTG